MSNGLFTIDNYGFMQMEFIEEFSQMMKDNGYEDPFWRHQQKAKQLFENMNANAKTDIRQWLVKNPLPTTYEETQPQVLTPGKKYISQEDWNIKKHEYVACKLYEMFGMDERLQLYCKHNNVEYLIKELKPCMAGDRQCSLFCPDFPCSIAKEKEGE